MNSKEESIDQPIIRGEFSEKKDNEFSMDDFSFFEQEFEQKKKFFPRFWSWLTVDKGRLAAIIFLLSFVILIIILAALNLNMGEIMQNIVNWFESKVGMVGIYIGVGIISIFGNFTVIFPVPYTLTIVTVAVREDVAIWEVVIVGLCAGIGASIGEISAWLLGRASKKIVKDGLEKQLAQAQRWVDKGLIPIFIFLFASLPLPDDTLLLMIGLIGYSLWKTVLWCSLGKVVLTINTGLVAKLLGNTKFGSILFWLFGLKEESGGVSVEDTPSWLSAIVWIVTIFLIGLVMFVDWKSFWTRITISFERKKYTKLLTLDSLTPSKNIRFSFIEEKSNHQQEKGYIFSKIGSNWQGVTKNQKDTYPIYHDLYSIPYVLKKKSIITINSEWIKGFNRAHTNKEFLNIEQINFEKIIPPKKIRENEKNIPRIKAFIENAFFISFLVHFKELKSKFKLTFLMEKSHNDQLRLLFIGEKEAIILNSYKINVIPIFNKLLAILDLVISKPELINRITYASFSPPTES